MRGKRDTVDATEERDRLRLKSINLCRVLLESTVRVHIRDIARKHGKERSDEYVAVLVYMLDDNDENPTIQTHDKQIAWYVNKM